MSKYDQWSKTELIKRVEALEKRKKYGLVWDEERAKESFEVEIEGKLPVLKEVVSKQVKGDPDKPTHIIIEGDNYHALSALSFTHDKSIDLIFIDPPYNIGKGDFLYNDKIVDADDGYRHSKWLSFMDKRLRLARNLLKDTGAIFITIDDHEAAHLKLLCDEIFQPQNFVSQICWQKKFSPQNDATYFSDMHDAILVYAKKAKSKKADTQGFSINGLARTERMDNRYSNPDNDPRGDWTSSDCTVKTYSKDYDYPITSPSGRVVKPPESRCWFTSRVRMDALIKDKRIWFGKNGGNVPRVKCFLSEVKSDITPTTWWTHQEAGHNQEAKQELKRILPDVEEVFDTPKPVRLLKRILELAIPTNKTAVILDFFAGSGTTAQAVLEFNEAHKMNHQCILCTNNENNIASAICYPRIKRVIEGYEYDGDIETVIYEEKLTLSKLSRFQQIYEEYQNVRELNQRKYDGFRVQFRDNSLLLYGVVKKAQKKPGCGGSLKYFQTAFVPSIPTDKYKELLSREAVELLCLRENTFSRVSKKSTYQIFRNNEHCTAIIFDHLSIPEFKKEARKLNAPFSVYVFSLGEDDFIDEFAGMKNIIKVCPVPEGILCVYRRIFGQ